MVSVFDFTDFRAYLKMYYEHKKKLNPHFSYQLFAQRAGLKNRGFLFGIINSSKKLSKLHCFRLSKALGHSKKEAEYFENIVFFNQAKNDEQRHYFLEQALKCKRTTVRVTRLVKKDEFEYLSKWYHSAIRAFIEVYPVNDDYEELSRVLSPPITPLQAKNSIRLLQRLNLISRKKNGTFYIKQKNIKASDEITQDIRNRYYTEYNTLARNAINSHDPSSREITSLTLGISKKTRQTICKEIRQLKERIIELADNDEDAECIYHYQHVFFSLINRNPSSGKDDTR